MESLFGQYKDKGVRVLAFPANNFGNQEPGTNAEITSFCRNDMKASFDVFAKVSVKGKDKCDLYKFLTGVTTQHEFKGEVQWNFQKYVVDKKGKIVARFDPPVSPTDEKVTSAIDAALKAE